MPNRDSVQVGSDPANTTSFNDANRITTTGYSHDDEGRMTARPGQVLEWDGLGRLVEVEDGSSNVLASYTYDALDRLLTVDRGATDKIRFRYVGLTTQVAEIVDHDDNDAVIRWYVNDWTGQRLLDWTGTSANQRYYGTNAHHDVSWTADDTGAVTATLRYDPWGELTSSSGNSLPDHRFQGSWVDTDTDLYWVVARWYAPDLGRFVSEDSLLGKRHDPPSRHLYAYALGDPIGMLDPTGTVARYGTYTYRPGFWGAIDVRAESWIAWKDDRWVWLTSTKFVYSGPAAPGRIVDVHLSLKAGRLRWKMHHEILFGDTGHKVAVGVRLTDTTRARTVADFAKIVPDRTTICGGGIKLAVICLPPDFDGDKSNKPYQSTRRIWSSELRIGHQYRVDIWMYVGALAALGSTGVTTGEMWDVSGSVTFVLPR